MRQHPNDRSYVWSTTHWRFFFFSLYLFLGFVIEREEEILGEHKEGQKGLRFFTQGPRPWFFANHVRYRLETCNT